MNNIQKNHAALLNTKDRVEKDALMESLHKAVEEIIQQQPPTATPELKTLHAEICWDFSDFQFTWDWTNHKLTARSAKQLIRHLGMKTCKEKKAKALLIIGEQVEGAFISEKMKWYWLRPANKTTATTK